jgi:protein SCO1/2
MFMVLRNQRYQPQAQELSVRDYGLTILPFQLIDQDGRSANESSLRGQWTVVDFIFTNCVGACPTMTSRLAEAALALEDTPVRFASFSLDSERDTPERLRKFAEPFNVDFAKWSFFTGDNKQTRKIVEVGLKLVVDNENTSDIGLDDGSTMKNIIHPTRYFLVNPELEIVGLYSSGDPSEVERLVREVTEFMSAE